MNQKIFNNVSKQIEKLNFDFNKTMKKGNPY